MNTDRFKPFAEKGRILAIDPAYDVTWDGIKNQADAVIIQLGGIDGENEANHWLNPNRIGQLQGANDAGIPVILRFNIASRYYHQKGITAGALEVLDPVEDPVFDEIVTICDDFKIAAIDLFYWDWTGWPPGTLEVAAWVKLVTNTWIDGILLLQNLSLIPAMPVIFETWPGFIVMWDKNDQPSEFHQGLINRLDKVYLNEVVPDPLFPEIPTAQVFSVNAAFEFAHEGTDKYQWVQGIDNRPLFWGFTKGRFKLDCLAGTGGNGTGELLLSSLSREAFRLFLGVTSTPPPPPPPPPTGEVTLKDIMNKLALQDGELLAIKTELDSIKETADALNEYKNWIEPRLKAFIK